MQTLQSLSRVRDHLADKNLYKRYIKESVSSTPDRPTRSRLDYKDAWKGIAASCPLLHRSSFVHLNKSSIQFNVNYTKVISDYASNCICVPPPPSFRRGGSAVAILLRSAQSRRLYPIQAGTFELSYVDKRKKLTRGQETDLAFNYVHCLVLIYVHYSPYQALSLGSRNDANPLDILETSTVWSG